MKKFFLFLGLCSLGFPFISQASVTQTTHGVVVAATRAFTIDLATCREVYLKGDYSSGPECSVHLDFKEKTNFDVYVSGASKSVSLPGYDDFYGVEAFMLVRALTDGYHIKVYSKTIDRDNNTIWNDMQQALKREGVKKVEAVVHTIQQKN